MMAVIIVICKPDETDERNSVRSHWRHWEEDVKKAVRLLLFVGLPKDNNLSTIRVESTEFDDIIMEAMQESYYSLTLKTLRMLKWFLLSCTDIKYLVKSDLDTFINLPNLINYFKSINSQGPKIAMKFVGGDIEVRASPIFDPSNKWYMPPELLETVHIEIGSPYPDYAQGAFYVLSSALIPDLFINSLNVRLIQFEDVFLTGIVANRGLGINLTQIPNVYAHWHYQFFTNLFPSYYNDSIIACHLQGNMDMMYNYYAHHQSKVAELKKAKRLLRFSSK